ncbi:MAG: XRE family transcriptional regulator [Gammaproteobacteria bacterium]|nr:XRE family transcriptional regulator [Gammaproteobacteria bacterium]
MAKPFKELRDAMPLNARKRAHEKALRMIEEMPLHELRRAKLLTQRDLAEKLQLEQAAVSKMERRTDMLIGSLRRYIEAMGGTLDIVARFPDGDVQIKSLESI